MNPEISALRKVSLVCSYFACLNLKMVKVSSQCDDLTIE